MPHSAIRPASREDIPELLRLIRGLAAHEGEPDGVLATEDSLAEHLFKDDPVLHAWVAPRPDGQAGLAGIAVWYLVFSTWECSEVIHLEDLFIDEPYRGHGLGRALFTALAQESVRRGYPRLDWNVQKVNARGQAFYRSFGAYPLSDLEPYRLDGEALRHVGHLAP